MNRSLTEKPMKAFRQCSTQTPENKYQEIMVKFKHHSIGIQSNCTLPPIASSNCMGINARRNIRCIYPQNADSLISMSGGIHDFS
uniref:Uncharacterized protein n=1 Tax=Rhizophora mucronata TaxID=61149 RepID=A0A2P2PP75_RHIMU